MQWVSLSISCYVEWITCVRLEIVLIVIIYDLNSGSEYNNH